MCRKATDWSSARTTSFDFYSHDRCDKQRNSHQRNYDIGTTTHDLSTQFAHTEEHSGRHGNEEVPLLARRIPLLTGLENKWFGKSNGATNKQFPNGKRANC